MAALAYATRSEHVFAKYFEPLKPHWQLGRANEEHHDELPPKLRKLESDLDSTRMESAQNLFEPGLLKGCLLVIVTGVLRSLPSHLSLLQCPG